MRTARALVLLAAVVATPAGVPGLEEPTQPTPQPTMQAGAAPWNVVLLTVDTLRADHLGVYGYGRDTTPAFDAYARSAVVFDNAFAVSAWTFPGLVSLLTGVHPSVHGFDARGRGLRAERPHLPGLLRRAGYRVPRLSFLNDVPGFEALEVDDPWEAGRERGRGDQLLEWLRAPDARQQPFFAWYHHRSPHLPYDSPPPYSELFGPIPDSPGIATVRRFSVIPAELQSFQPEEKRPLVSLYDSQLRVFDDFFSEMVATLERNGLADRTVVVVTADHGEELLDHGLVGHASNTRYGTLYDEILHIPLIIRVPGRRSVRVSCQASQIDVMPTLLALARIDIPPGTEGRDLGDVLSGGDCEDRPVFADSVLGGYQAEGESARAWLWAIRTPGWKLIERRARGADPTRELYDLEQDPQESNDLYASHPERAAELEGLLGGFVRTHGGTSPWERPLTEPPGSWRASSEVAAAPRVLAPQDGARLRFSDTGGLVQGHWTGSPRAVYVFEYDIGQDELRTTGTLEIQGTRLSYGPMPLEVWQGMAQFNPWRFRLYPKADPTKSSEWITVTFE